MSNERLSFWPALSRWCALIMTLFYAAPTLAQVPASAYPSSTGLRVLVTDTQQAPIPGAAVVIFVQGSPATVVATATTDEHGTTAFPVIATGTYTVRVAIANFDSYERTGVRVAGSGLVDVHAVLAIAEHAEQVSIQAPKGNAVGIDAGPALPAAYLERRVVQRLPLPSARLDETLSIVPGVVRSGTGEISMKGASEQQSGLLVNGFDASDPATGDFRLSLPVDSVEAVQVFLHPYTAEYGQFVGGLTKVETRAGGDRWHFEVNDFLPDLRFVNHKIVGIAEDTPHVNLSGPIAAKLHLSQSLGYTIAKRPVRGLEFPSNETRNDAVNSFTQIDAGINDRRSDTLTLGYFVERARFVGLDVFRPQPVTPNATQRDLVTALHDRYQIAGGLLDSAVSLRRFETDVWPQGLEEHTLTPTGERGNYFSTLDRLSSRLDLSQTFTLPTKHLLAGSHDLKFGVNFNAVTSELDSVQRPVNVVRADGTAAERIEFEPAGTITARNREVVGFIQDRWLVRPGVSVDIGLRYENQRLADGLGVAPRLGIAWAPANGATVVRGGVGTFFDKVPLNIRSFSQYPSRILTEFGADGMAVDRKRVSMELVDAEASAPFDTENPEPKSAYVPNNRTWNVQADRSVTDAIAVRVNFVTSSTHNIYIVNPQVLADGSDAIVLQSTGRSLYRALETTARMTKGQTVFSVSYVRSAATGDLNDFNSSFGDFAVPIIQPNQYSRLPSDVPHRLLAWGSFSLPRRTMLAPIVEWRSGFPYSIRDEEQQFVGVRNADTTRFPVFKALDLEAAKEVQLTKKYGVRLSVRVFNVTNHFNPRDVRANIADPGFGQFLASYRRYFAGGFDVMF